MEIIDAHAHIYPRKLQKKQLKQLFSDYCSGKELSVDELLCDGLHPNDRGYKVMFDLIIEAFQL